MKQFGEIKTEYKINKRGNPLTDLIKEFMEEVNKERNGKKFKKLSYVAVMKKLEGISEKDLRIFMSNCKDYKNRKSSFSKCFFGCLKNRYEPIKFEIKCQKCNEKNNITVYQDLMLCGEHLFEK